MIAKAGAYAYARGKRAGHVRLDRGPLTIAHQRQPQLQLFCTLE